MKYFFLLNYLLKRSLIHIDLGFSLIKKYPSSQYKSILLENGLNICQPFVQKTYFIIRTPIS
jgi:hypothetical protein